MHYGIPLIHFKNEILSCAIKWLQLETIMFSEIRQSPKYKYHMFSLMTANTYTENKTKQM